MARLLEKISPRELVLLLIGTGCVATCALFMALLAPKIKTVRALNETVEALEDAALDGDELANRLRERQAAVEALRYRLHGDMASLPIRQVEAFVIGRLQKLSWGNDVDLVSVEPAVGDKVAVFQETEFNVRLNGRYFDLYRWLWGARQDLGFVVIKQFKLSRNNNDNRDPVLVADLTLASYRPVE